MLRSYPVRLFLGLFLLVIGSYLLWDVWSLALSGGTYEAEQGVYAPLCVIVGLLVLFSRIDFAGRAEEHEKTGNRFWNWNGSMWLEAILGILVGFGHLFLLNWVAGK